MDGAKPGIENQPENVELAKHLMTKKQPRKDIASSFKLQCQKGSKKDNVTKKKIAKGKQKCRKVNEFSNIARGRRMVKKENANAIARF
jgi:hypothetical protein